MSLPSLINARTSLIEKVCRAHLNGLPVADFEEAVQETLLRLIEADRTRILNIDAWLATVAYYVCASIHRRRYQLPEVDIDSIAPLVDQSNPAVPAIDRVAAALILSRLAREDRQLLTWRYVDQLSYAEIAALLHITPGNARIVAFRVRARARAIVADAQPEDFGIE